MNHPNRYPIHDNPNKGQVFDGICNVTACDRPHARFWNVITHAFYCKTCADGINRHNGSAPIVIPLTEKPASRAEMDRLFHERMKEVYDG